MYAAFVRYRFVQALNIRQRVPTVDDEEDDQCYSIRVVYVLNEGTASGKPKTPH